MEKKDWNLQSDEFYKLDSVRKVMILIDFIKENEQYEDNYRQMIKNILQKPDVIKKEELDKAREEERMKFYEELDDLDLIVALFHSDDNETVSKTAGCIREEISKLMKNYK